MINLETAHSRNNYLREFAHKTVTGTDTPYQDGHLPELKRLRYYPVTDDKRMQQIVKRYSNRPGEYISVYAFEKTSPHKKTSKMCIDYNSAKINRIYLDFDDDTNPQHAIQEAILTIKTLTKYNLFCHCYFSGGRGVALYIEFQTTEVKPENKKEVVGAFFDMVVDAVGEGYEDWFGMPIRSESKTNQLRYVLSTIDYGVRGDIARVSRIPNTRHKSGLYCIPLTFGDMYKGIGFIKELAKAPRDYNLEDVIIKTTMRNYSVPTIIQNLEKVVIAEREHDQLSKAIKQHRYESYRRTHKNQAGIISDKDVEDAKSIPLSHVIGTSEERIKCPIHHGDNPSSFYIDHKKGLWNCYSCRQGGSGIDFIMKTQNVDFKTAVLKLLKKA